MKLLWLMRKVFGCADVTELLFEQNFHEETDKCARCGSTNLYIKMELKQWVNGKLKARKIIPYCFNCCVHELM